MATRMKKLPGVLSFQRCMFPTDALFYNLYSGKDKTALPVIRHGIRGTQNINKTWSEKATEATVASAKRDEVQQYPDNRLGQTGCQRKCPLRAVRPPFH